MTSPADNATGWKPPNTYDLVTPDGRTIQYCVYGPEGGHPLVAHSGTPGTRLLGAKGQAVIHRAGVRVLVADRPGYGGSTRRPGRTVADVAADVALLAYVQGWDRFGAWGASGGGPHALACAALLPGRVTRCAAVVCPAPYDGADLDWLADMSPGNVEEFSRALEGEASYRPLVEDLSAQALDQITAGDPAIPPGYDLPEPTSPRSASEPRRKPTAGSRSTPPRGPVSTAGSTTALPWSCRGAFRCPTSPDRSASGRPGRRAGAARPRRLATGLQPSGGRA